MPNQKATEMARNILDDLRGSAYYADTKVLADLLQSYVGTEHSAQAAVEILRRLLYKYASARPPANAQEIEELAEQLQSYGVQ